VASGERLGTRLRRWANGLKQKLRALYLASRHPRTPWYAKALAVIVVGYAFSPIDLIPDPIPILGYLDDAILLPLGIWLTLRLIPDDVWGECEAEALAWDPSQRRTSWIAAAVIVLVWVAAVALLARAVWPWATGNR
jgi:uncharacterized membrane protein YkvA (DUF1232 family)